jgi:hypothetical protein
LPKSFDVVTSAELKDRIRGPKGVTLISLEKSLFHIVATETKMKLALGRSPHSLFSLIYFVPDLQRGLDRAAVKMKYPRQGAGVSGVN